MKVLIADDHAIFREGLRLILGESGRQFRVGEAANREELLERVQQDDWQVIILDISFPGCSGLELLHELKALRPAVPVLVLSMYAEEQYAVRALRSGAAGYLTKSGASDELLKAIEKLARGGRYVTPAVADLLAGEIAGDAQHETHRLLSDREFEVFLFIARGSTPTEIAACLNLSVKTVSTYRSRILEKMGFKTNARIIHYAIEHRLL
jgi:two-component system, NarL family, invasion response regulator UvrY